MTDRCIVCNAEIPEGRQVCPMCEGTAAGKLIKGKTVKEAFETIVSYCAMRDSCEGCCFSDERSGCCFFALNDIPCDWKLPERRGG